MVNICAQFQIPCQSFGTLAHPKSTSPLIATSAEKRAEKTISLKNIQFTVFHTIEKFSLIQSILRRRFW